MHFQLLFYKVNRIKIEIEVEYTKWFSDVEDGDTLERLLTYNPTRKQERALSSFHIPVDNSSFVNLTRLVSTLINIFSIEMSFFRSITV